MERIGLSLHPCDDLHCFQPDCRVLVVEFPQELRGVNFTEAKGLLIMACYNRFGSTRDGFQARSAIEREQVVFV